MRGSRVVRRRRCEQTPVPDALMPYTFLFWQGGRFTAFAPEQTKCMLADVDFEEIERVRVRNEEVVTCAEACTTFYGVVSLDDATFATGRPVPIL